MLPNLCSKKILAALGIGTAAVLVVMNPDIAYADLDQSIRNVRTELSNVVLPTLSVIGLLVASFSYLTGNQNAKQHITYALIGAAVGFGAQSIIDFISSMIR